MMARPRAKLSCSLAALRSAAASRAAPEYSHAPYQEITLLQ